MRKQSVIPTNSVNRNRKINVYYFQRWKNSDNAVQGVKLKLKINVYYFSQLSYTCLTAEPTNPQHKLKLYNLGQGQTSDFMASESNSNSKLMFYYFQPLESDSLPPQSVLQHGQEFFCCGANRENLGTCGESDIGRMTFYVIRCFSTVRHSHILHRRDKGLNSFGDYRVMCGTCDILTSNAEPFNNIIGSLGVRQSMILNEELLK